MLPEGLYPMKVNSDTNWDRTSYLPICPKQIVLSNVVDPIILVIIIIKIMIVVFRRYVNIAHLFVYSNIATGMTHLIKEAVEGKDSKWWSGGWYVKVILRMWW